MSARAIARGAAPAPAPTSSALGKRRGDLATRKRIIRTLIEEIVVRVEDDDSISVIRWAGGITRRCACARTARANTAGDRRRRRRTRAGMARQLPDKGLPHLSIVPGRRRPRGIRWTRSRVAALRTITASITSYREVERAERGEATLDEAAKESR